jgi:hypothetical protein
VHPGHTHATAQSGGHSFHTESVMGSVTGHDNAVAYASEVAGSITGVQDTEHGRNHRQRLENALSALNLDSPGQLRSDCTAGTVISLPSRSSSSISPLPECSTPAGHMSTFVSPGLVVDSSILNTAATHSQPQPASMQSPGSPILTSQDAGSGACAHSGATCPQPPLQPCTSPAHTPRDNGCIEDDSMLENSHLQRLASGEGQRSVVEDREAKCECDQRSRVQPSDLEARTQQSFYHGGSFASHCSKSQLHNQVLFVQDKAGQEDESRMMLPLERVASGACSYRVTNASSPQYASSHGPLSTSPCLQRPDVLGPHGMQQNYRAASPEASLSPYTLHDSLNKLLVHPMSSPNNAYSTIAAYKGTSSKLIVLSTSSSVQDDCSIHGGTRRKDSNICCGLLNFVMSASRGT